MRTLVLGFHIVYGIIHPGNCLLGVFLVGEINVDSCPLSQSPLGQLLVPRSEKDSELVVGLKFPTDNHAIPSFQRKQGVKVIRLREEKEIRDERTVH